ncbi:MAG: hypothetical protein ACHQAU_01910 [Gammaproteobacteria bacterium]|jgi:hypothetical protein
MTKLLMTCGLLVALTACATSQPAPSAAAAPATPAATETAAAAPAAQTGAAPVAAAPGKSKLVCEETDQMGSHFQQRVCMTPEQAEARRKAAQEAMRNYQNSTVSACGDNGCSGGPPR